MANVIIVKDEDEYLMADKYKYELKKRSETISWLYDTVDNLICIFTPPDLKWKPGPEVGR
jgi:hypothetical protein